MKHGGGGPRAEAQYLMLNPSPPAAKEALPRRWGALFACQALFSPATCGAAPSGDVGVDPVPRFRVDTTWPKPLPNQWLLGQVSGIATDANDHVWVLQRPASLTEDERGATLTPP